jgi:hypothetical protein
MLRRLNKCCALICVVVCAGCAGLEPRPLKPIEVEWQIARGQHGFSYADTASRASSVRFWQRKWGYRNIGEYYDHQEELLNDTDK